jgi:hypothetical protein
MSDQCEYIGALRLKVLCHVEAECKRQDEMWGHQRHTLGEWATILGEEYGEYCQAINETVLAGAALYPEKGGADAIMKEAVQVAAVAVQQVMDLLEAEHDGEVTA